MIQITSAQRKQLCFPFVNLILGVVERIFAVLFHIGASIIVFYACKDKSRFWLYPLAILLHTAMDFVAGLTSVGVWNPSVWALEKRSPHSRDFSHELGNRNLIFSTSYGMISVWVSTILNQSEMILHMVGDMYTLSNIISSGVQNTESRSLPEK